MAVTGQYKRRAYTQDDDPYGAQPQTGPNAPTTPPPGSTPAPGGGWEMYTPTGPNAPPPPAPTVPPTSESRRPPQPTAPPTGQPTTGYEWQWQEGQPTWDPAAGRYTYPMGTWDWQRTGDTASSTVTDNTGGTGANPKPPTTGTSDADAIITRALQQAYGRAPNQTDLDYWRGKWNEWGSRDPTYFEQRLQGLYAGPQDYATAGPYAGGQGYSHDANLAYNTLPGGPGATAPTTSGDVTGANTPDPFAAMGGGTYVPGIGWYPTANLTDEMKARLGQSASSTTSGTTAAPDQSQIDAARRNALMDMLTAEPPTAESLTASPEAAAYRLQAQRGYERDRANLAESAAFQGADTSGAFDTELSGLRQSRAEGEAGFVGQLAITRMQQQRDELRFAITQAQDQGQFELSQALQREAMNLDAAIRREQLAQQNSQFGQSLSENARQANNSLGFNYAQLLRNLDQNAVGAVS